MKVRTPGRRDASGVAAGFVGSVAVHATAAAFLLFQLHAGRPEPGPPVYAVNLVAAPLPTQQRRVAREAIPTPPPPRPQPPPEAEPEPAPKPPPSKEPAVPLERKETKPKPKPEPTPPAKTPAPEDREAPPPTAAPVEPLPGETPSTGTDVANISTPGLAFPYPEYLQNIMNQVLSRFGQQQERRTAHVAFVINRDGTVRDIKFLKRSGDFGFDLEAQGAIESAANARAFGPLPSGWESDILPVVFIFEPR